MVIEWLGTVAVAVACAIAARAWWYHHPPAAPGWHFIDENEEGDGACDCFLFENYYSSVFNRHLRFTSAREFREQYGADVDAELAVAELLSEQARRRSLRHEKLERRAFVSRYYQPIHPELWQVLRGGTHGGRATVAGVQVFDPWVPGLLNALGRTSTNSRAARLRSAGVEEHLRARGVYTFRLFTPEFCKILAEEVRRYEEWTRHARVPHARAWRVNSMHKRGADFGELGLRDAMTAAILTDIVRPLSLVLFGGDDGEEQPLWLELDAHKAFVVSYDADDSCGPTDRYLDYHWVRRRHLASRSSSKGESER